MSKKAILIIVDHYLPGFKSGGPVKSIANILNGLLDREQIDVLTKDRDLGDENPYNNIESNSWNKLNNYKVYYMSSDNVGILNIYKFLRRNPYRLIYLNSFFSLLTINVLIACSLIGTRRSKLLLAPRGEFSPGALEQSRFKKYIYIKVFKIIFNNLKIVFHASNEMEKLHIEKTLGPDTHIRIASDIPDPTMPHLPNTKIGNDVLNIVFISRISPKKNILYALKILTMLDHRFTFDIYGPIEDQKYWESCVAYIDKHDLQDKVFYRGAVKPDKTQSVFKQYDVFFFPTLGENFGHVIYEALASGCPVLTSDMTPWDDLEKYGAGWTIPLVDENQYVKTLAQINSMSLKEKTKLSERSWRYANNKVDYEEIIRKHIELFEI
ncbi:glycosyltransferase [Deinococcus radiopugnans]|uniref:glycosyltransferase n=1 Tax=Deinococcus radiopugnans TaxID=57497 RepID=UPI003617C170